MLPANCLLRPENDVNCCPISKLFDSLADELLQIPAPFVQLIHVLKSQSF